MAVKKVNEQAQTFYNRAKTVFPHEGKVYHLLAQLSNKEKDHLSAIYNCARALSCSFPSTSAETREMLINILEEIRIKDIEESKFDTEIITQGQASEALMAGTSPAKASKNSAKKE